MEKNQSNTDNEVRVEIRTEYMIYNDRKFNDYKKLKQIILLSMSENSRCVIVMTNLAFAPDGRKRVGAGNWFFDV